MLPRGCSDPDLTNPAPSAAPLTKVRSVSARSGHSHSVSVTPTFPSKHSVLESAYVNGARRASDYTKASEAKKQLEERLQLIQETVAKPNPTRLFDLTPNVVRSRKGAVLTRGIILKTDYYASGRALDLEYRLKGAPNFRGCELDVYGTAQPSLTGLRTMLALLNCQPPSPSSLFGNASGRGHAVWFCTREEPIVYIGGKPFVLRDAAFPKQTFSLSNRAENLEQIEARLKNDILKEAARYGGLIMVNEELPEGVVDTWISASPTNVFTVREIWEMVVKEGFAVDYHRVPISSDQNPDDNYLDSFLSILRNVPTNYSLIINDGMGVVRTTFAMCLALLIRRRQVLVSGGEEPIKSLAAQSPSQIDSAVSRGLALARAAQSHNRSLLRLMRILQRCLNVNSQRSVIEIMTEQPSLLENMVKAIDGNYHIILALLSCLQHGSAEKLTVDAVVDHADAVINLREAVLEHRLRYSVHEVPADQKSAHLRGAIKGLERYFFLIAFASFLSETEDAVQHRFSTWYQSRKEVRSMVSRMRTTDSFFVFTPVHDLSALSKDGSVVPSTPFGNTMIGEEWAHQIIRLRSGVTLRAGLILKRDIWHSEVGDGDEATAPLTPSSEGSEDAMIQGAINFRKVHGTHIFGLSQPTQPAIKEVLDVVAKDSPNSETIVWLNLREEPLIYINGFPTVLREEAVSLRNMDSYAGITSGRLELLEERLKADVLAELQAFDGRLLLHTERADGTIAPVWETVEPHNVKTLREVMASVDPSTDLTLNYERMPITAEKMPDFTDITDLMSIISQQEAGKTSIVVNCQLGRGRSTLTQVMILLVLRWRQGGGQKRVFVRCAQEQIKTLNYQPINNLLRVLRNGKEIKAAVDTAISQCSHVYNLLSSVEDTRQAAEACQDANEKAQLLQKGLYLLQRYFSLILFAAWLNDTEADTLQDLQNQTSYERFVKDRPVFQTIEKELDSVEALIPLEKAFGNAATLDEEQDVLVNRSGRVLTSSTMLKSDFFLNLQKNSLPERVPGAPNFRRVPLYGVGEDPETDKENRTVIVGSGMPTVDGLRGVLERMETGKDGKQTVFWTSMREEPVLYVNGRPHVLRLAGAPLENVVTTGVTTEAVEAMEKALKADLIKECHHMNGRVLLHDEVADGDAFRVVPTWEDTNDADILTPKEVFERMRAAGFRVDYDRLPVTDEQAPIPMVFSRLQDRVIAAHEGHAGVWAFNCQMGRGRTTTGMVAAALVSGILYYDREAAAAKPKDKKKSDVYHSWDREGDQYLQGDYKIILQLVSVLQYGKKAKRLVDHYIDVMEGVQNLRKAIYTYKLQVESTEANTEKHRKLFALASNYLFRYGSLIAFASYLLERYEVANDDRGSDVDVDEVAFPSFSEWLGVRREITSLLNRRILE